jgi:hypothetical protein
MSGYAQGPKWVIFRLRAASQPGPFIPQQQTCGDCIGMSVLCCQLRTPALQQSYSISVSVAESAMLAKGCSRRARPGRLKYAARQSNDVI